MLPVSFPSAPTWGVASALARLCLSLLCLGFGPGAAWAATLPTALLEFKHEAWSIERGAPSRINSITQTPDGFLWIGSVEGLFRFDGVSFEPVRVEAADTQKLVVSTLRTARSGALWVGLARGRGVALLREGRLQDTQMPNPSREVNDIQEDPEGGIWVARGGRSSNTLARFHRGAWQELDGALGLPEQQVWRLLFARDGTMWVVLSKTLAYRKPGETRFRTTGITVAPHASLSEDAQGRIWISDTQGTRLLGGPAGPDTFFAHPGPIGGSRLLFDRKGDLWTTTWNGGVLRIRAPGHPLPDSEPKGSRLAALNATAGLSSDQTRALFQDREGSIWVGTELGLDLLRPANVVVEPGLPRNSPTSYRMAAARDGTVYVADSQALYAIPPGGHPQRLQVNTSPAEALCAAGAHGVWLFLADRVLRVEAGAVQQRHTKPAGSTAYGCAEDASGRLWMPGLEQGLHWLQGGTWQRWPEALPSPSLPANAALDQEGRAIVVFRAKAPQGALPFLALEAARSNAGGIEGLLPTQAGVLVSGNRGLAQADGSGTGTLTNEHHPWAASLNGVAQTPDGDTWAIGDVGIVRLRSSDLANALRQPGMPLAHRIFDFQDGLNSFAQKSPGAQAAVGGDGRVWFLTRSHVVRITPTAIETNRLQPPVVVRSIQVGDTSLPAASQVHLPAGTTTVRLSFSALSLKVPGRVQFQYRLLGADERWSAPGKQRSAVLTDLRPGSYRFQVRASNDDGLWSEHPTEVTLTIPALFTESTGFKVGVAVSGLLLLYGLYLARVRQILARLRERSEARSRERERIARDMHDTLLQSVQGLILRFQSLATRLHGDPPTQEAINQALDRAEAVVIEGRDRLQGLRRGEVCDLEHELRRLISEQPFSDATRVTLSVRGQHQALRIDTLDEALCIVREALFNAARHADASEVVVSVDYGRKQLAISVQDDGVGMARDRVEQAERAGHLGMLSMRERARRLPAQFSVVGDRGQGTRIQLLIKANVAYGPEAA